MRTRKARSPGRDTRWARTDLTADARASQSRSLNSLPRTARSQDCARPRSSSAGRQNQHADRHRGAAGVETADCGRRVFRRLGHIEQKKTVKSVAGRGVRARPGSGGPDAFDMGLHFRTSRESCAASASGQNLRSRATFSEEIRKASPTSSSTSPGAIEVARRNALPNFVKHLVHKGLPGQKRALLEHIVPGFFPQWRRGSWLGVHAPPGGGHGASRIGASTREGRTVSRQRRSTATREPGAAGSKALDGCQGQQSQILVRRDVAGRAGPSKNHDLPLGVQTTSCRIGRRFTCTRIGAPARAGAVGRKRFHSSAAPRRKNIWVEDREKTAERRKIDRPRRRKAFGAVRASREPRGSEAPGPTRRALRPFACGSGSFDCDASAGGIRGRESRGAAKAPGAEPRHRAGQPAAAGAARRAAGQKEPLRSESGSAVPATRPPAARRRPDETGGSLRAVTAPAGHCAGPVPASWLRKA